MRITDGRPEHTESIRVFLEGVNALRVARRGELLDALAQPAVVAWADDVVAGVATYVVRGDRCELLTLHAARRYAGAGTALVAAVRKRAAAAGCRVLWLVTTNDNVDALRFYQRRGFRLAVLRPDALELSRRLKPEIPLVGDHGIPLRDEIELEMALDLG